MYTALSVPLLPVYTPPSTSSVSPDYTQCDPQCNGPTYLVEELGTERFVQVRHHETATSLAATRLVVCATAPRDLIGRLPLLPVLPPLLSQVLENSYSRTVTAP